MGQSKRDSPQKEPQSNDWGSRGEGPENTILPELSGAEGAFLRWTVWQYASGPWKYGVHLDCTHPDRQADAATELCRSLDRGRRKCLSVCMRGWRITRDR